MHKPKHRRIFDAPSWLQFWYTAEHQASKQGRTWWMIGCRTTCHVTTSWNVTTSVHVLNKSQQTNCKCPQPHINRPRFNSIPAQFPNPVVLNLFWPMTTCQVLHPSMGPRLRNAALTLTIGGVSKDGIQLKLLLYTAEVPTLHVNMYEP